MGGLWAQLAISAGMFLLTIVIHLLGLACLVRLTRVHIAHLRTPWVNLDRVLVPAGVAFGLAMIHMVEVAIYAGIFTWSGATGSFEEALFFSVGSYSTADVATLDLRGGWRLVGALEALNGILLLGWSTAFLFDVLHRVLDTADSQISTLGALARSSPRPKRPVNGAEPGDTEAPP